MRLDRSILRRWPNAASVSRSMHLRIDALRRSAGTMCTTAEVTLGGGTKAERLTRHRDSRAASATARRPTAGRKLAVRLRRRCARRLPSGTSGSASATTAATARRSHLQEQRRPDIVGQVGDDVRARRRPSARSSIFSASASMSCKPVAEFLLQLGQAPGCSARSRSTATTLRAGIEQGAGQAARARARPRRRAGPSRGPGMAAIRASSWRSRMKFWPSALLALSPCRAMTSRSGSGAALKRSLGA